MTQDADQPWQRLDQWLWCARFVKMRAACARFVAAGGVRINRQPTDKAHAKLRPGDVLTLPMPGGVRVIRVLALGLRRGPAPEARLLYAEIAETTPSIHPISPDGDGPVACAMGESSAYPPVSNAGLLPSKERL